MDFEGVTSRKNDKEDSFKILYTGSLSIKQRPIYFLKALSILMKKNPSIFMKMRRELSLKT